MSKQYYEAIQNKIVLIHYLFEVTLQLISRQQLNTFYGQKPFVSWACPKLVCRVTA
jgi:hypothetical protein